MNTFLSRASKINHQAVEPGNRNLEWAASIFPFQGSQSFDRCSLCSRPKCTGSAAVGFANVAQRKGTELKKNKERFDEDQPPIISANSKLSEG